MVAFGFIRIGLEDAAKFEKLFTRREEYDRQARGKIIYAAVQVESAIEQIIAVHFCEAKNQPLFISLMFVVGQVTFSQKLIILKKLLKENYPDLLRLFPKMFTRLDKLRELRNKLAHSKIGYSFPTDMAEFERILSDEASEGTTLEYFKDGYVVHESISREQVEETLVEANAYENILTYVAMEIKNRVKELRNHNFAIALRYLRERYPKMISTD